MPILRAALAAVAALLCAAPAALADLPDLDTRDAEAARTLADPGGPLTGPAAGTPGEVAQEVVADQRRELGLDGVDVAGLEVTRTTALGAGATNVFLADEQDGVPLFGADLRVVVADDGSVLSITGTPAHDVEAPTLDPAIGAPAALTAARADAGLTGATPNGRPVGGPRREWRFDDGSTAKLVRFPWGDAAIVAWRILLDDAPSGALYDYVVDGFRGSVLYRHSLVSGAATGSVFPAWPGAPVGGAQVDEDFTSWLTDPARLLGNNAHVWTDLNADDEAQPTEEVPPSAGADYRYPYAGILPAAPGCPSLGCSWNPGAPRSWETNLRQDATQIFSLVNRMHDWLLQPSIGFTEAAGNFQAVNVSGSGRGGDPVRARASYGADTDAGMPLDTYRNNANMGTPPDGSPPSMRMYLWMGAYPAVHGGIDPSVVLHEYTHGLSHRLVIDADGLSTLTGMQGGAMGEGWSDWYAVDYLVDRGYETDDPAVPGDAMTSPILKLLRSQPIDCPVGSTGPACPGTAGAGPGGYTYGDYGKVQPRGPEVHDDGEIWAQTLWDLRQRMIAEHGAVTGVQRARSLVTRAMQLSSPYPTFLDMRNAILRADATLFGGADADAIWEVFANRGMGWFASTSGAADTSPVESFATRPPATGTLAGRVTADGEPIAGVQVAVDAGASTVTGADGRYALELPAGTYPRVTMTAPGRDPSITTDVPIAAGATTTRDAVSRRNWIAVTAGAEVVAFAGGDNTEHGAGPRAAADGRRATAWVAELTVPGGPPQITLRLPQAIDLTGLTIDPLQDPRLDAGSSLGAFRVEVSSDGAAFRQVASGTFGAADTGRDNPVAVAGGTAANVRFVRLWADASQGATTAVGVTEIGAYGRPTAAPPAPAPAPGPAPPSTDPAPAPPPAALPVPPAPVPVAPIGPPAPTAPSGSVRVAEDVGLGAALRRGVPVRLSCAQACRARVVVRSGGRIAGVRERALRAGRPLTLRVRLRDGAADRLRDRGRARLRVHVTLTGPDGGRSTLRRAVTLRR